MRRGVASLMLLALLAFGAACVGGGDAGDRPPGRTTDEGAGERTEAPAGEEEGPARPAERSGRQRERSLVWVGIESGNRVALVDVAAGKVLARHASPGGPHNVTVAGDGTAAVTLYGGDELALVRRGGVRFVELGGSPHDVKAAGRLLAVANEAAGRIDLVRAGEHVASIQLGAEPHDLAITPNGARAWVTLNGTGKLAVIDLRARRVVRYVSTKGRPHDLLFAPDGDLWVTDWEGPVQILDERGRIRGRIELGEESHHLAFTPDGKQVWITDHGAKRLFVVNTRRRKVLASLRVAGGPHHVAITPDGALAVVTDHEPGTIVVYDVKSRSRVRTIRVGAGPHGVWAVPTNAAQSVDRR